MIRFKCTSCDKPIKAPDDAQGKRCKCPKCGKVNHVPVGDGIKELPRPGEERLVEVPSKVAPVFALEKVILPERESFLEVVPQRLPTPSRDSYDGEDVLYRNGFVIVTPTRFLVGHTTHIISKINSITSIHIPPNNGTLWICGTGAVIVGLVSIFNQAFGFGLGVLLLGIGAIVGAYLMKSRYAVIIVTSSGREQAVVDEDAMTVRAIVRALNQAVQANGGD